MTTRLRDTEAPGYRHDNDSDSSRLNSSKWFDAHRDSKGRQNFGFVLRDARQLPFQFRRMVSADICSTACLVERLQAVVFERFYHGIG